jgi:uncharacterized protein (UPF0332 family)
MNDDKNSAILLKLRKARVIFNEASVLMENKFYATVINRLYYSCYHALKALLLTKDIISKTDSGTAGMLYQHFVQPGFFDMSYAAFYNHLLQQRMEEEYSDFVTENKEIAGEMIEPARSYLQYVETLIDDYLKTN